VSSNEGDSRAVTKCSQVRIGAVRVAREGLLLELVDYEMVAARTVDTNVEGPDYHCEKVHDLKGGAHQAKPEHVLIPA